jgi:uncharacterized membrane protein YfcA
MLVVSIIASLLGQGGGVMYTPIQVYTGIDFHTAATTSLFLIMVTSLSATVVYRKANKVDWPLAIALETVTATGGLLGGLFSGKFSGKTLSISLAAVLIVAAIFMIRRFSPRQLEDGSVRRFAHWRRHSGDEAYTVNMLIALPASCLAGAISGLVGVGGGVLKVPLMVLLLGVPTDIAVGSSAFMVGVTAAGGFAGHTVSGHWDWQVSLILAAAVFIGGQIGARTSIGIDKSKLQAATGWFLLTIALSLILKVTL